MLKISLSQLALSTASFICLLTYPVTAQITPDNSLGSENSIVTPNVTVKDTIADLIEGGAIRGNNLFHSFSDFNVDDGAGVYFANPEGIANILTRVTGNNISEIFGTVGVLKDTASHIDGGANLFLLNPNGIVFGENVALDVNGSFLATTADSYVFENEFAYSASNPETPTLLTINIPVGIQMGANPGDITVRGAGHNFILDPSTFSLIGDRSPQGLEVKSGKTLALIGGEINFTGGNLTAPAGRIELGSVGQGGAINIMPTTDGFTFDYPEIAEFQDINFSQAASIEVSGDKSGNLQLQGKNITLEDGTVIIAHTLGSGNGGKIEISATDSVKMIGSDEIIFSSGIFRDIEATATGNSDSLTIKTDKLQISNNAFIINNIVGSGNGGNLEIVANQIEIFNSIPGAFSGLSTIISESGRGKAGDIIITTKNLAISDDSGILSDTLSQEKGGDIAVTADSVKLTTGGFISTSTLGDGNTGDINLEIAETLEIDGQSDFAPSGIFSQTGNIDAQGDAISVKGNGGEIKITAGSVRLTNVGTISASTTGEGDAGDINLEVAKTLEIDGGNSFASSGVFSQVGALDGDGNAISGQGNGGEIKITAGSIRLTNGGGISASTGGEGDAGDINLEIAGTLEIDGQDNISSSGIDSQVGGLDGNGNAVNGKGNGGEIKITAGSVALTNGGIISGSTAGEGDAGDINLEIADSLSLSDRGIIDSSSEVSALGKGGNIKIQTDLIELTNAQISTASFSDFAAGSIEINSNKLQIKDQGNISVSSFANGNSGNLSIVANELNLDDFSSIEAKVNAGSQGNINLTTDNIFLNNNSEITVEATGTATGGNISINNQDNILLLQNSQIIADAIEGNGGNINITTQGLFVSPDSLISASSEFGLDGNIEIKEVNGDRKFELNKLPENIRDLTNLITVTCTTKDNNTVAVIGNGGIPHSPYQTQSLNTTWYDLRPVKPEKNEIASLPTPLIEATMTMIDGDGELALVALTPLSTHRWFNSSCAN